MHGDHDDGPRRHLRSDIAALTAGRRVVVVANRAPFRHDRAADGSVTTTRSASGLVTALEPLVAACGGTWVAHAAGTADLDGVDDRGGRTVPPANPRYRLRHVPLSESEYHGYYHGFANEGLWPLCHAVDVPPVFRPRDFVMYRTANARFAAAVCEEMAGDRSLVFVQDYHFALLPRMLRAGMPHTTVVSFWHIPWPEPRILDCCAWRRDLLDGLLGSDVVGVQTPDDAAAFLDCVEAADLGEVDRERSCVEHRGHVTCVRAYPVGVEWHSSAARRAPSAEVCRNGVRRQLGLGPDVRIGIGVDRLDYTKGLNEKFLAVERLLERHPDLRGRFTFVQVAEPSRTALRAYQTARDRIAATCDRVNARFGTPAGPAIVLLQAHHEPEDVYRLYRAADVCYVASLRDGMNLVAKEFVSARDDERGVLVLSERAGAARQLRAALIVDPSSIDAAAQALWHALEMPVPEQARRMRQLRKPVEEHDTFWWVRQLMSDAAPRALATIETTSSSAALTI